MAETIKVLAQSNPGATTLTDIYTIPASTAAVISSIVVCNQGSATVTFRISIQVNNAADDPKQYLYHDLSIPAHDTFVATLGVTLAAGDVIAVYAGTTDLSFNVFGTEIV